MSSRPPNHSPFWCATHVCEPMESEKKCAIPPGRRPPSCPWPPPLPSPRPAPPSRERISRSRPHPRRPVRQPPSPSPTDIRRRRILRAKRIRPQNRRSPRRATSCRISTNPWPRLSVRNRHRRNTVVVGQCGNDDHSGGCGKLCSRRGGRRRIGRRPRWRRGGHSGRHRGRDTEVQSAPGPAGTGRGDPAGPSNRQLKHPRCSGTVRRRAAGTSP